MLIDKINETLNTTESNSTMHIFCTFIKENLDNITNISIEEVSRMCYMSKGQVSKCAKNLGFKSYIEFKDSCLDYKHSISDKPNFFSIEKDLPCNIKDFSKEVSNSILFVGEKINYSSLNSLINDIIKSKQIYLYAQGDNRSLCNILQTELSIYNISITICDADFSKNYTFKNNDLLIIISTNGNIFNLYRRITSKLLIAPVKTWIITCNNKLRFKQNILLIPSYKYNYNKFAIKYIIDIIISYITFSHQINYK